MKSLSTTILFIGLTSYLFAQDNVGIGTTTPNPNSILELVSADQGFLMTRLNSGDTSTIGNAGSNTGIMFYAQDVGLFFFFNGSKWESLSTGTNYWGASGSDIYNLNTGNIGFGTSSPLVDFQMEGANYTARLKSTQSTSLASTSIAFGRDNGGGGFTRIGSIEDPGSGDFFRIETPYFLQFLVNGAERMRVTGTGQVGIGTSGPTATLDVDGTVRLRGLGGNGNQIVIVDNSGNLDTVNLGSTILWAQNGTDIYNLNSGGVSIGGTSTALKLQVTENLATTNPIMAIQNQNSLGDVGYGLANTGNGESYVMGIDASDGTSFKISNGGFLGANDRLWINSTGNFGIGANPGTLYRVYSYVDPSNTTTPYGFRSNNNYSGTSTKFGIYNNVTSNGTGIKYGTYNLVAQPSGEASAAYGTLNFMNHDGTGPSFGLYNNSTSATTTGSVYGVYNVGEDYNYFDGAVGVGFNTPEADLHVYAGAGPSGGGVSSLIDLYIESNTQSFLEFNTGSWAGVSFNDDNQSVRAGYLYNPTSDYIQIKTGGVDSRLVVDENGDVGIGGVINPVNRLDVEGGVAIGSAYSGTSTAPTNGLIVEGSSGIGVSSLNSAYKLHVNTGFGGTERYAGLFQSDYDGTGTSYGVFSWMTGAGTGTHYGVYVSNGSTTSGTEYGLYVTGEDRNYFSGPVGIGTTSPSSQGDLHVASSSIAIDASSAHGIRWVTGNSLEAHIFRWSLNDRLYFTNNGPGNTTGVYLADGATWWTSTSDRRLKENIVESSYGLEEILKLNVKEYNYINTNGSEKEIGLIAQEVYEVIPEIVQKGDDGPYRGNGNAEQSQELGFSPWGIEYSALIPVLVKSVQELAAEVEDLKVQNQKLRSEMDRITNK